MAGSTRSPIIRAAVADIVRYRRGLRPIGASTITQQLVRHFLLTNEVSVARKIKEALLAYRIERYLSKERILEIYLNEIYLGAGSYGVAAAGQVYFGKDLDQLTPAEAATLAALPKAPQTYNPLRNPVAAKTRRDWVLAGMAQMGWLPAEDARTAMAQPVRLNPGVTGPDISEAGYFVEDVRRELVTRFGEKLVYEGGLTVRTSYTAADQRMAEKAFRDGLVAYDRRHGWRGPLQRLGQLASTPPWPRCATPPPRRASTPGRSPRSSRPIPAARRTRAEGRERGASASRSASCNGPAPRSTTSDARAMPIRSAPARSSPPAIWSSSRRLPRRTDGAGAGHYGVATRRSPRHRRPRPRPRYTGLQPALPTSTAPAPSS